MSTLQMGTSEFLQRCRREKSLDFQVKVSLFLSLLSLLFIFFLTNFYLSFVILSLSFNCFLSPLCTYLHVLFIYLCNLLLLLATFIYFVLISYHSLPLFIWFTHIFSSLWPLTLSRSLPSFPSSHPFSPLYICSYPPYNNKTVWWEITQYHHAPLSNIII